MSNDGKCVTFKMFTKEEAQAFYLDSNTKLMFRDFMLKVYGLVDSLVNMVNDTHIVDNITFTYNKSKQASGSFAFYQGGKFIELNFAQIKTYRDLLFVFFHEWTHARQHARMGLDAFKKASARVINMSNITAEEYLNHEIEREADQYALAMEESMNYKSFVINPSVKFSVFMSRKALMK